MSNSSLRQNIVRCLTAVSHGSAPFISTFILIHLSAPALASLGGSSLSSQTMLLGREYYQSPFSEKYLVLAPLALHALAGTTKRLLSTKPASEPRPLSTLLSWTGYSTMLLFLPIHFLTHRVYPTSLAPPIASVGPSELDYEFVKTGLEYWPKTSWILYTGLVLSVSAHLADGATILWNTYLRKGSSNQSKTRTTTTMRAGTLLGLVVPVLGGVYVLSNEPSMLFPSMAKRFKAVFASTWVYRL